jgi:hypothetical protein
MVFAVFSFKFRNPKSLPARSPACQSPVRRAGASAKAGAFRIGTANFFMDDPKFLKNGIRP